MPEGGRCWHHWVKPYSENIQLGLAALPAEEQDDPRAVHLWLDQAVAALLAGQCHRMWVLQVWWHAVCAQRARRQGGASANLDPLGRRDGVVAVD